MAAGRSCGIELRNADRFHCDIMHRHAEGLVAVAKVSNTVTIIVPAVKDEPILVLDRFEQDFNTFGIGVFFAVKRDDRQTITAIIGHLEFAFFSAGIACLT